MLAAAVNPSDVASAEGRFPHSPLPRILGRDFAGRVSEGPAEWVGAEVWGTGKDLGIARAGTHAEELVIPVEALARRTTRGSVGEARQARGDRDVRGGDLLEVVRAVTGGRGADVALNGRICGARILSELAPLFETRKLAPHGALEHYPLAEAGKLTSA